jgi:peptidoglycan/LPS O-acetylase OafA/YrhL
VKAAAVVQAVEAVGMLVATGFSADATISGKSYQTGSGVALTLIAFGVALAFAAIARGLSKARPWSRTPSAMTQVFAIGLGVYVLDGSRPEWGVPALLLAVAGLVLLFAPASFKALNRDQ